MNFKNVIYVVILFSIVLYSQSFFEATKQNPNFKNDLNTNIDSKTWKPYDEYRVHRAGILWLTVSNMGIYGNPFKKKK